ncbi:hypothetical protein GGI12_004282, partial [Dipsacomyces acuminosporus]
MKSPLAFATLLAAIALPASTAAFPIEGASGAAAPLNARAVYYTTQPGYYMTTAAQSTASEISTTKIEPTSESSVVEVPTTTEASTEPSAVGTTTIVPTDSEISTTKIEPTSESSAVEIPTTSEASAESTTSCDVESSDAPTSTPPATSEESVVESLVEPSVGSSIEPSPEPSPEPSTESPEEPSDESSESCTPTT